MAQVARISGPLLAANLKRTQANLAFDTDLLYVGHLTGKIGINKASPGTELDIFGQTWANDFLSDTLTGGNLKVDTTGITSITGNIILDSAGIVHADEMHTEKLTFNDNYIGSLNNSNIVLDPNGAGVVNFPSTKIQGNVSTTGNITIPGNITVGGTINFGDAPTDTLDFDFLDFTQDLVPHTTAGLHNLGSATNIWNNVNTGKAIIGDIEIDNDYISTSTLNNNLTLRASGTGSIIIHDFDINGHNIITPADLQIEPGSPTGSGTTVALNSTAALRVPDGTEAQRTNLNRDVRYNTTTNFFELFSTAYTPLRGIWSEDRQTYVLANAGNDFSFVTNGVTNTTLSSTSLTTNKLISQSTVEIDGKFSLGQNSVVENDCKIIGPVIIGNDCTIEKNSVIGPNVSIGDNSKLTNCNIQNSIIMENCIIDSNLKIRNSILASNSSITINTDDEKVLLLGEGTKISL